MTRELVRIPFDEFSSNLEEVFERVLHGNEAIFVEKDEGEVVVLKPAGFQTLHGRKKTEADYKAFRSSAGGWADTDTDTLIENIYKSRDLPAGPQVEL